MPLAVGDFDGDGNLDIALALVSYGSIGVFFGRGDGSFEPIVTYDGVVGRPVNVLTARFGDPERTDLVVIDFAGPTDGLGHLVVLSISTARSLSAVASMPLTANDLGEGAATVADLNRDGVPDFAVAVVDNVAHIEVFLSAADGGWSPTGYVPDDDYSNDFVGDFNEDGVPDVIAVSPTAYPTLLSLFLGKGDGTFSPGTVILSSTNTVFIIAIGDLNGDGHLDLLVSDQWPQTGWTPYLGRGDGTFASAPKADLGASPWEVRAGWIWDLNGDQHPDYVGVRYSSLWPSGASLGYALGNGDGTFQPWVSGVYLDGGVSGVAVGDMNNDGRPDVIVSDFYSQQVSVFLNNCGGPH
jgi:hypothetical protein